MIYILNVPSADHDQEVNVAQFAPQTPPSAPPIAPLMAAAVLPVAPAVVSYPLVDRQVIPANDRRGGYKYMEAIESLKLDLQGYDTLHGNSVDRIKQRLNMAETKEERKFLRDLLVTLKELEEPTTSDIRKSNSIIIEHMRKALTSRFYQQTTQVSSTDLNCRLLQQLCMTKFTGVHGFVIFRDLVNNALISTDSEALRPLGTIDKHSIGPVIRKFNHSLQNATGDYAKSWFALNKQKFQNNYGVKSDQGGGSNVPYLRSRFRIADGASERSVDFCRFGTPTLQALISAKIDPLLFGMLDDMRSRGEEFLYVNHQKLEGKESKRSLAIRHVENQHKNFHFMSIPMDGQIMAEIRGRCEIESFKALVIRSFMRGENGCALPSRAGISPEALGEVLDYVHSCWFNNKTNFTTKDLEAFWGIFSASLQDLALKKLPHVRAMNTSCKDNKDRGGTIGAIDEAVRNLLLNRHNDPVTLCELVYNTLAPFMIKLEHILDDPENPNHHRLGFLISVLDRISTLSDDEIARIQDSHTRLLFGVIDQSVPRDSRVMES